MSVTIYTEKLAKNKIDACFYYDEQIGIAEHNKRIYSVESRGSLEVMLNDCKYKGDMARKELTSLGYTDKKLKKLYSNDKVIFNNWFALIEINKKGECISDDLELAHDYDDCITILNNIGDYVN
jgi:hypothetical protein